MKKIYSFALMALTMGFVFVSCDKDNKDDNEELEKDEIIIHKLPVNSISGVKENNITSYTLSMSLKKNDQYYLSDDTTTKVGYYFKDNIEIDPFIINHTFSSSGFGESFTFTSCTDATTPGFTNLSAITTTGVSTNAYLISNSGAWNTTPTEISFKDGKAYNAIECYVTNSTYAYLAIKDHNDGNPTPYVKEWTDQDIFTLTITGYNGSDIPTGSVEVKLAEGMNILKEWKKVDLTSLGKVKKIVFTMSSTDSGQWGINTPTYFCLDQLKVTE